MLMFALLTVVNAADSLRLQGGLIIFDQTALADAVGRAPSADAAAQTLAFSGQLLSRVTNPNAVPDRPFDSTVASLYGRYRTEVHALLGLPTIQDPAAVVALIEGWQTLAANHSVPSDDMVINPYSEAVTDLLARARQEAADSVNEFFDATLRELAALQRQGAFLNLEGTF